MRCQSSSRLRPHSAATVFLSHSLRLNRCNIGIGIRAVNGIDGCPGLNRWIRLGRRMIEVRDVASVVIRRLEPAASAERLHPRLVNPEVHERIRYTFGGGAKPRSATE